MLDIDQNFALLLAIAGGSLLIWAFADWLHGRSERSSECARRKIALGVPAMAESEPTAAADRDRLKREFAGISSTYRRYYRSIERARDRFSLARDLRIVAADGAVRLLQWPAKFLRCDVVLGWSVAGAGLTPGTAVYWLELPGAELKSAMSEARVETLVSGGRVDIECGHIHFDLGLDSAVITDRRSGGFGSVQLKWGSALLLGLEPRAERYLEDAFGEPHGSSSAPARKVRLFGGFRVENNQLMIVPLRHEMGEQEPSEGFRLHPLERLAGIIVADERDAAFSAPRMAAA